LEERTRFGLSDEAFFEAFGLGVPLGLRTDLGLSLFGFDELLGAFDFLGELERDFLGEPEAERDLRGEAEADLATG
jgi:hypothetical protein